MIIFVKGTSGSGKSTGIRNILSGYDMVPEFKEGRKQPIGYDIKNKNGENIHLMGHYETACGGCDSISDGLDYIFDIIRKKDDEGSHVIAEGLLMSQEVNRTAALAVDEGREVVVFGMDIPIEKCLESVNGRRQKTFEARLEKVLKENAELEAAGKKLKKVPERPGPVKEKNTISKHKQTKAAMRRLSDDHLMDARWVDREQLVIQAKELLSL